jgi:gamma-glutamyltranspeptidase/glutathione hydrolase
MLKRLLFPLVVIALACGLWLPLHPRAAAGRPTEATHGIVLCEHPLAAQAGLQVMREGGNAVDAVVCAILTQGVVAPYHAGIGGGGFLLIKMANQREPVLIDYRETAPARATSDMYVRDGKVDPKLSRFGALAVAVPGSVRGYEAAVRRFGKKPLARALQPGIKWGRQGIPVDAELADVLTREAEHLRQFPDAARIYLNNGQPLKQGELLRQVDLANTYQQLAVHGADDFYRGALAQQILAGVQAAGGILSADDLAAFQPTLRQPVEGTYRGHMVYSAPPPSSGGVDVIETLQILDHFDLRAKGLESAAELHLLAEAMRPAYADRSKYLGDPAFTKIPLQALLDPTRAARLASQISETATRTDVEPGGMLYPGGTAAFAAVDADGNVAVSTDTINLSFGSMLIPPGTGIVLNDEMDDFSAAPGVPNAFGLIGGEANKIEPGKRPLSSMAPTMVLDKTGHVVLGIGAAGGSRIISAVIQGIVNVVDFDLDAEAAVSAPRMHDQWRPDVLYVENEIAPEVVADLEKRGHKVERMPYESDAVAVRLRWTGAARLLEGGSDPRGLQGAAGY